MKKMIVGLLLLTVFTGLFANGEITGGPSRKQPIKIIFG